MLDDRLFYTLERRYGAFDIDALLLGQAHAFATYAATLDDDWAGRVWVDLSAQPDDVIARYLSKAVDTAHTRKRTQVLCCVKVTAGDNWHFILKYAKHIRFVQGALKGQAAGALIAVVEFCGVMKGLAMPSTLTLESPPDDFNRVSYLKRRAANKLLT